MSKSKIVSLVIAGVCFASFGGGSALKAANPHKMMQDTITVKITKSNGTTWGKVFPEWKNSNGKLVMGNVCKSASCTYTIPHMTRITLTQSPTHKTTWPFKHWTVTGSSARHKVTSTNKKI